MLDFDLAELYQTATKYLKRAVRSNTDRFPPDFMFELTKQEWESLRCKISTSNTSKRGGTRYLPFAFTEQGVAMLASVLNSHAAIQVNIAIVRAFVLMRQFALNYTELAQKIAELESRHDLEFADVWEALDLLLNDKESRTAQESRKKNWLSAKRRMRLAQFKDVLNIGL